MRVAFYTLGCKVNQYETFAMMKNFSEAGFEIVEPELPADVYIINSCTVTSSGDKKSRQAIGRMRALNPDAVICLTGCMPQAFPEIASEISGADIISGSKNRAALLEKVLRRLEDGSGRMIEISPHEKGEPFEMMNAGADISSRTRALVKIEDGCERFCAYCVIPRARGPVRSKSLDDIKTELINLAESGYKEVVLVGINLSCYGKDIGLRLLDAVKLACSIDGIERVRLGSLEPELLTPADIKEMSMLSKLCPHFHLSLQSGCDETLARMKRHYTTHEYAEIVKTLRAHFPDCSITTDIMTGFPGETEDEHKRSLAFAEQIGFAKAHIFPYSPRSGTAAANMENQIDKQTKTRRSKEMTAVTDKSRADFLRAQEGKTAEVLFETLENGMWKGYTRNYTPVAVSAETYKGNLTSVTLDTMRSAVP